MGIGKTNPLYRLDVNGQVNSSGYFVNGVPLQTGVWSSGSGGSIYYNGGNVGIGTANPGNHILTVRRDQPGYTYIASDNAYTPGSGVGSGFAITEANNIAWYLRCERDGTGKFNIGNPTDGNIMTITGVGVGIGTTDIPSGFKLAVNGNVIAEEVWTDLHADWPDYVFNSDYNKMDYVTKEKFYLRHKRLPYMPAAGEVKEKGLNLSGTMIGFTRNVEENRLDITELFKKVEKIEKENEQLRKENLELKKVLKKIK